MQNKQMGGGGVPLIAISKLLLFSFKWTEKPLNVVFIFFPLNVTEKCRAIELSDYRTIDSRPNNWYEN